MVSALLSLVTITRVLSGIWGLVVVLTTMDRKYIAASSRYSSEEYSGHCLELCVI